MSGEKTEKATPKKRNDERKKGNAVQSKDVVTTASVVVMFFLLKAMAPYIWVIGKKNMARMFTMSKDYPVIDMATLAKIMIEMTIVIAIILIPILLTAMAVGVIGTGVQTKFLISTDKLKVKFSNLNPISGLKKMVSIRSLVEILKSSAKLIVIGCIIYNTIVDNFKITPKLLDATFEQAAKFISSLVYEVAMNISIIFFFIAIFDYAYQWWENEKNLKMSKQDIKEEYKSMEGDPQVKS
ncbi:MAG: EscU/YscU/HrcU family type III secretion system export apparatus switch protein, partial [Oscillospiraceae bacterium]